MISKIAIFGANGGTGIQLVQQALDMGDVVTAIVRNPDTITWKHKNLIIHKGDVLNPDSFGDILEDQDAVISALGIASNKPTKVFSVGIQNIITAMEEHNIERLIAISAIAVEINRMMPFWMRLFIKNILQPLLNHVYSDTLEMEQIIMKTDLSWTIVRPPQLTNKKVTGRYRIATGNHLSSATKISRADLAHYVLHHLHAADAFRKKVEVAY